MKNSEFLRTIRAMVDSFINEHRFPEWEKFRKEHPYTGVEIPSLQSFVGTDLLIDFITFATWTENNIPHNATLWVRTQGTQLTETLDDEDVVRKVFGDIITKIKITYNGSEFETPEWIDDDDCVIRNKFIKENKLYPYCY